MGDFNVRGIQNNADRNNMFRRAINDIKAFELMLQDGMFDSGPPKIGAEQELCIINEFAEPANLSLEILNNIKDARYTNELALFNLEINLDPLDLEGSALQSMESSLVELLQLGYATAEPYNARILMTGILPTLKYRHLVFENMTPEERYKTLSKALYDIRGKDFEIYIQGVDELIMSLGSVLFEACNTSFQLHLQISPDEFVNKYNWSQMITGPVLSACTNSPLLFGNELWAETRVALFKQSLDTRSAFKYLRRKLPRIYFGNSWMQKSPAELWKNDLMRFPLLLTSDDFEPALKALKEGRIPNLRAIRLHNGTTYTWNRLCYGFSETHPHLRIECRYLPSGPSPVDEIANFAFWVGLMNAEPPEGFEFWKKTDFNVAKNNFIKAARTGLNTVFMWYGKAITAKALILEVLLPLARKGLQNVKIHETDIEKYLGVIEQRISKEQTGSGWIINNFRTLSKHHGKSNALNDIVNTMYDYQKSNTPIHQWDNLDPARQKGNMSPMKVEEVMSTDIISISENDSIEFAKSLLKWNNIHHLPVENINGDLVGLITDGIVNRYKKRSFHVASDIMLKDIISIQADHSIDEAVALMKQQHLSGLPVIYKTKLVGMLTMNDLHHFEII